MQEIYGIFENCSNSMLVFDLRARSNTRLLSAAVAQNDIAQSLLWFSITVESYSKAEIKSSMNAEMLGIFDEIHAASNKGAHSAPKLNQQQCKQSDNQWPTHRII